MGTGGYILALSTPGPQAIRYDEYDYSRGHMLVERLLGKECSGVLSTDFYAAYNVYLGRHQRCWVHLAVRDLHELRERILTTTGE